MKIRRSILLVPAGDARKVDKSREAGADVLMIDLQDSVPFDDAAKQAARRTLRAALDEGFPRQREVNVRVNAVDSPWLHGDLETVLAGGVDSVTLPEFRSVGDVAHLERMLRTQAGGRRVPAVLLDVETPAALLDLERIAREATLVDGLMVGVNDYALEVHSSGALFGQQGEPSHDHLAWIGPKTIAVARAYDWTVAETVMLKDFKDLDAARAAMAGSKRMGFDGWIVLVPYQVGIANEVFGPSPAEVAWAAEVIALHAREQAVPAGERQATVRRQHLQAAQYLTGRARDIEAGPPAPA